MDISQRTWMIKAGDEVDGPLGEDDFQNRLRRGQIPLRAQVKSNMMDDWRPLLEVVSTDETFQRPSTMPPPAPDEG